MILLNSSEIRSRNKNKTAFTVYCYSQKCFTRNVFSKILFDEIKLNEQKLYDEKQNWFNAPCNGVFSFSAGSRITGIEKGYAGLGLFINNALFTMVDYKVSRRGLISMQGTVSVYLSKGDKVDLRTISTSQAKNHLHANTVGVFIWFSGSMLFEN